jgi:hypothetical protein
VLCQHATFVVAQDKETEKWKVRLQRDYEELYDMSKSRSKVDYLKCRFARHLDDMQWPCTGDEL